MDPKSKSRILTMVEGLHEPPLVELERDRVQLDGQWHALDDVRVALLEEGHVLHQMHCRGFPLDWLGIESPRTTADDLTDDQGRIDSLLEARVGVARRASAEVAHGLEVSDSRVVGALHSTLSGVSQAIRASMPRALRRQREAYYELESERDAVRGHWQDQNERLDWRVAFLDEAQLSGLDSHLADRCASLVWREMLQGVCRLPGFTMSDHGPAAVRLRWERPHLHVG